MIHVCFRYRSRIPTLQRVHDMTCTLSPRQIPAQITAGSQSRAAEPERFRTPRNTSPCTHNSSTERCAQCVRPVRAPPALVRVARRFPLSWERESGSGDGEEGEGKGEGG